MISTFLKSGEQKNAAAEAINYYNRGASFSNGALTIRDFGGEKYGHPLVYYSKSYRGESLYLTTKIMELDSVSNDTKSAIEKGLTTVGGLPMFAEYIPFLSVARVASGIITSLLNLFNRDDHIVSGHDCDLHFRYMHERQLQSGRILCLPQSPLPKNTLINEYELRRDNVLVHKTGTEYTDTSYFVIKVDARQDRDLEDFEHFVGAADLLAETNRGGTVTEIVDEVVALARKAADIDAIRDMERLSREDDDNADSEKQIKALYKSLSPEVQAIYEKRKDEILAKEATRASLLKTEAGADV